MPRMPLHPASGTGTFFETAHKTIRFVKYGCTNRPFFHVVVMHTFDEQKKPPIEQLGTYDPMPNSKNEKAVSFNYERIIYWLGKGAVVSDPVAKLLGLAGFLPIHPNTYRFAWQQRRNKEKAQQEAEAQTKNEATAG